MQTSNGTQLDGFEDPFCVSKKRKSNVREQGKAKDILGETALSPLNAKGQATGSDKFPGNSSFFYSSECEHFSPLSRELHEIHSAANPTNTSTS